MTLQSIADRLGVSRSTVSNAYNRPDRVSEGLRTKILAVAEEIGYAGPDPIARRMRTGRQQTIGLIFTDSLSHGIRDPAAFGFLEGLTAVCEDAGLSLLLVPAVQTGSALTIVGQAAVDGFVLYSMPTGSPHIAAALRRHVPLVNVDGPEPADGHDWVGLDDEGTFRRLGTYLRDLGHREVGVVCSKLAPTGYNGPVRPSRLAEATYTVQVNRLRGLRSAFAGRGTSEQDIPVEERFENTVSSGVEAGHALLDRHPGLTAIVCTSDVLALGVLQAARERGLSVPGDLSVTGHDDVPYSADVGLTTVEQPLIEKGRTAGRLLLSRAGRPEALRTVLPTQLHIRKTTGPAPTRRPADQ